MGEIRWKVSGEYGNGEDGRKKTQSDKREELKLKEKVIVYCERNETRRYKRTIKQAHNKG